LELMSQVEEKEDALMACAAAADETWIFAAFDESFFVAKRKPAKTEGAKNSKEAEDPGTDALPKRQPKSFRLKVKPKISSKANHPKKENFYYKSMVAIDGGCFLCGGSAQKLRKITEKGENKREISFESEINDLHVSFDRRLAAVVSDTEVRLLQLESLQNAAQIPVSEAGDSFKAAR
jgi:hypothetical protein